MTSHAFARHSSLAEDILSKSLSKNWNAMPSFQVSHNFYISKDNLDKIVIVDSWGLLRYVANLKLFLFLFLAAVSLVNAESLYAAGSMHRLQKLQLNFPSSDPFSEPSATIVSDFFNLGKFPRYDYLVAKSRNNIGNFRKVISSFESKKEMIKVVSWI